MPTPLPAVATANVPARETLVRSPADADDVFYPSSDGKPMAENMWQAEAIMNAAGDLKVALPGALVAADILVYPVKGNPYISIAPDVLVAFGLATHKRLHYRVWVEGKPPDWVLEVASPSTEEKDRLEKGHHYAGMGVPEYWMFDPSGDTYKDDTPRLVGLELVGGEYQRLDSRLVAGERVIRSEVLGLDVLVDDELLRFRDPATGQDVRHRLEDIAAAEKAEASAERAKAWAERAKAWAERAEAQAGQEAADRKAAEARVAELEAALRRAQGG